MELENKYFVQGFLNSNQRNSIKPGYFNNKKLADFEAAIGKDLLAFTPLEMRNLLIHEYKLEKVNTLNNYRNCYKLFFEAALDSGVIKSNIFDDSMLDHNNLVTYMGRYTNISYFTSQDIENISSQIKENKLYMETLIRLFYEGVISSVPKLYKLRRGQINEKNCSISLGELEWKISERLLHCCLNISQIKQWITPNGSIFNMDTIFRDALIPIKVYHNTKYDIDKKMKTLRSSTSQMFSLFSKDIGIKITTENLYQSGLVSHIKKNCKDDNEFIDYILGAQNSNSNPRIEKLNEILGNYNTVMDAVRVRYVLKPYALQMQLNIGK